MICRAVARTGASRAIAPGAFARPRPMSTQSSWLNSTKTAVDNSVHTTRFGMKTCSCCVARTVGGIVCAAAATVVASSTVVSAISPKEAERNLAKASKTDNAIVAIGAAATSVAVVAVVLF
jgi:hypothetical protein